MRIEAPAKINLSLEVLGRRGDGYHDIRTLMVPLDLCDEVEIAFEPGKGEPVAGMPGVWFECSDPTLPIDATNLALRAVQVFFGGEARPPALRIRLTKRIPHGAGLGGGSSDAAAVLMGLARMHTDEAEPEAGRSVVAGCSLPRPVGVEPGARGADECRGSMNAGEGVLGGSVVGVNVVGGSVVGEGGSHLPPGSPTPATAETEAISPRLMSMAAEIGSDVPFFLAGGAAWCEGRGERVRPAQFDAALRLLLVKPPFGVPTPWAYGRWRDALRIPGVPYEAQVYPWGTLVNDLERPVFEKHLLLAELKRWLLARSGVAGALLAGSGSTMFAVLGDGSDAAELAAAVRREFGETMWCCPTGVRRGR